MFWVFSSVIEVIVTQYVKLINILHSIWGPELHIHWKSWQIIPLSGKCIAGRDSRKASLALVEPKVKSTWQCQWKDKWKKKWRKYQMMMLDNVIVFALVGLKHTCQNISIFQSSQMSFTITTSESCAAASTKHRFVLFYYYYFSHFVHHETKMSLKADIFLMLTSEGLTSSRFAALRFHRCRT